jgi:hypothetical protein
VRVAANSSSEYDGKRMLYEYWASSPPLFVDSSLLRVALVNLDPQHGFSDKKVLAGEKRSPVFFLLLTSPTEYPWLESATLVAKPDQLVKRRGELGVERCFLVCLPLSDVLPRKDW